MSGEMMTFPESPQEFIEQYSFTDKEKVYTNGSELIPVFRVHQMLEYYTRKPMERIIERLEEEATALEDNFGELIDCIPEHIAIEIVREECGIE